MDAREREARSVQRKLAVWSLAMFGFAVWFKEDNFIIMAAIFVAACAVIDAMRALYRRPA